MVTAGSDSPVLESALSNLVSWQRQTSKGYHDVSYGVPRNVMRLLFFNCRVLWLYNHIIRKMKYILSQIS